MKFRLSFPVLIGLVVLTVAGVILLQRSNFSNQSSDRSSATTIENTPADQKVDDTASLEPSGTIQDGVREVKVTAKQWKFIPDPIVVNFGEKVRLRITSTDVPHGFALPDFGINEVLNPGEEVVVEFEANKKGTFEFFCSVQCGIGHSGMRGRLVVK